MSILKIGALVFEWDDAKSISNLNKHGISFVEAATVFHDELGLLKRDTIHSAVEDRFLLIGTSIERRIVIVVHVERGERIRIISARLATARERRDYEQGSSGR
jgi:uncharacterized DUF497 family protein